MRKSLPVEPGSSAIGPPACFLSPRYCIRLCCPPAALLRMVFSENRCPLFGTMRRLPSRRSIVTSAPKSRHFRKGQGRMARQFIYHMQRLTKTYPPNRKVLENINLSFYPDAKIGVLGVNCSGKSTLLRIMARLDNEFVGSGCIAQLAHIGYLDHEPQLDPGRS